MRGKPNTIILFLLLFFGLGQIPLFAASLQAQELLIICNSNVPEDSLSAADLSRIYLGNKSTWEYNSRIVFVMLSGNSAVNEIHSQFLKKNVNKTPSQYINYWKKMIFTGQGIAPRSFNSEESLVEYVSRTDGAIGYIGAGLKHDNVKTLKITND